MANNLTELYSLIDSFSAIQNKNAISPGTLGSLLRQIASVCSQIGGSPSSAHEINLLPFQDQIDRLVESVNTNTTNISNNATTISGHTTSINNHTSKLSIIETVFAITNLSAIDSLKIPSNTRIYKVTVSDNAVGWLLVYRCSPDTTFYGQVMLTPMTLTNNAFDGSFVYGKFHIYHRCYNGSIIEREIATGETVGAKRWSSWREIAGDNLSDEITALRENIQQFRYTTTNVFFSGVITDSNITIETASINVPNGNPNIFWLSAHCCFAIKVGGAYYNNWTVGDYYESYNRKYYCATAGGSPYPTKLYICNSHIADNRKIYIASFGSLVQL